MTGSTLHITDGDSAVDRLRPVLGDVAMVPWRDVLHDGPVPAGLVLAELSAVRAVFIAERGWGELDAVLTQFRARDAALMTHDRASPVTLWFEHDLYDQLQLIQVLALLADLDLPDVRMAQADDYLGLMETDALRALEPTPVTPGQLALAQLAWTAFRAPTPEALAAVAREPQDILPFLGAALTRLLQELPAPQSGLSRTERQTLEVLVAGPADRAELFRAVSAAEDLFWLGDMPFFDRLGGLISAGLVTSDDQHALTELGGRVLAGEVDRASLPRFTRWLGGTQVQRRQPWRFEPVDGSVRLDSA